MHITEEKNELEIRPPEMFCDKPLGDNIPYPLPNKHSAIGIIGSPRSGKTSFAISLLSSTGKYRAYRRIFHNIYFVIPPNSRQSINSKIFEKHDKDKVYDELTPSILEEIKNKVMKESEEGYNSLLVIDDCTVYLKNKENEKLLKDLIFNRRH